MIHWYRIRDPWTVTGPSLDHFRLFDDFRFGLECPASFGKMSLTWAKHFEFIRSILRNLIQSTGKAQIFLKIRKFEKKMGRTRSEWNGPILARTNCLSRKKKLKDFDLKRFPARSPAETNLVSLIRSDSSDKIWRFEILFPYLFVRMSVQPWSTVRG